MSSPYLFYIGINRTRFIDASRSHKKYNIINWLIVCSWRRKMVSLDRSVLRNDTFSHRNVIFSAFGEGNFNGCWGWGRSGEGFHDGNSLARGRDRRVQGCMVFWKGIGVFDHFLIKFCHFSEDFTLHFLDTIKHIGHRAISIPLGK